MIVGEIVGSIVLRTFQKLKANMFTLEELVQVPSIAAEPFVVTYFLTAINEYRNTREYTSQLRW